MKRKAVLDGATAPAVGSKGVVTPTDWRDAGRQGQKGAPLDLRLSPDENAHINGETLFESVREWVRALRRGKDKELAIRRLRRLVAAVPGLALGVPEFLEYLAELVGKDDRKAIAHILDNVRRGRPLEKNGYLVALVDLVMKQEGCNISEACRKLHQLPDSPFAHIGVDRMRTIYSEERDELRAMRSYHVSERELAQVPRDLLVEILGTRTR